jgi:hypothetical protein
MAPAAAVFYPRASTTARPWPPAVCRAPPSAFDHTHAESSPAWTKFAVTYPLVAAVRTELVEVRTFVVRQAHHERLGKRHRISATEDLGANARRRHIAGAKVLRTVLPSNSFEAVGTPRGLR